MTSRSKHQHIVVSPNRTQTQRTPHTAGSKNDKHR
jgi:hypothetical protein